MVLDDTFPEVQAHICSTDREQKKESEEVTSTPSIVKPELSQKRPRPELNTNGQRRSEKEEVIPHCSDEGQSPISKRPRVSTFISKPVIDSLQSLLTFWLSKANLSKDRYLLTKLTSYDGGDGWAPVSLFLTFYKVQELKATEIDVTTALSRLRDPKVETETPLGVPARFRLQGGSSALRLRVSEALRNVDSRTIFLTSVPSSITREDITNAFSCFGRIQYISIPRQPNSPNRGFAFVEFQSVHSASTAVHRWRRRAYLNPQLEAVRAWPHSEWQRRKDARKKRARERSSGAKPKDAQPEDNGELITSSEIASVVNKSSSDPNNSVRESNGTMNVNDGTISGAEMPGEGGKSVEAPKQIMSCPQVSPFVPDSYEKGLVIHITGLSSASQHLKRAALYEALEEHGPISFVEFSSKQNDECFVRFLHVSGATRAISFLKNGELLGADISTELLSGEKEVDYWAKVQAGRARKGERQTVQNNIRASRLVKPRTRMNLRNK